MRGPIRALAKERPQLALELTQSLNTLDRRNRATVELIKGLAELPAHEFAPEFIQKVLTGISEPEMKDTAIVHVMEQLAKQERANELVNIETFLPLIDALKDIA